MMVLLNHILRNFTRVGNKDPKVVENRKYGKAFGKGYGKRGKK